MESSPVLLKTQTKTIEITCEVANNPQEIAQGLMGRKVMPQDDGMIFLFPHSQQSNFWMLNTHIPLSIAFFDNEGKIIDIQDMEPNTLEPHAPSTPFRGALEMHQGWFERNNIDTGDFINVPESSYPLMLNERIYYGDDVAETKHNGLNLEFEEGFKLLPWDEVDNHLIEKIYPRSLVTKNLLKTSKSFKTNSSLSLEDSPGLEKFLATYGVDEFHKKNTIMQQEFGLSYNDLVQNIHVFTQSLNDDSKDWGDKERERSKEWYPDEPVRVVSKAQDLGFSPETTSAVLARLSPSTQWIESPNFLHSGNRDESIRLLQTVKTLKDSGIKLDSPVKDTNGQIIIPKGTVDLDLTPDQIANLPQLKQNKRTVDSFKVLAAELAKQDIIGSPIDFTEQTARKKLTKTQTDPVKVSRLKAPKMMNFYHVILKKSKPDTHVEIPEDNMVIDRHIVDMAFNRSIYGQNKFKNFFVSQSENQPIIYDLVHSAILDAKHRSGSKSSNEEYQAFLWNGHLTKNKKEQKQKQSQEFVQSPRSKLFVPATHLQDLSKCQLDSIHDFLDL